MARDQNMLWRMESLRSTKVQRVQPSTETQQQSLKPRIHTQTSTDPHRCDVSHTYCKLTHTSGCTAGRASRQAGENWAEWAQSRGAHWWGGRVFFTSSQQQLELQPSKKKQKHAHLSLKKMFNPDSCMMDLQEARAPAGSHKREARGPRDN